MRRSIGRLACVVVCLCLGAVALAQTTGGLAGKVTEKSGAALPGVTVEASGPALQGNRAAVTDERGMYRIPLLPPGTYAVKFDLEGYSTVSATGVPISLGKERTLSVSLQENLKQEVTVEGSAEVIDTKSTTAGRSFDEAAIDTLPTQRNYTSVVSTVPGTSSDSNPLNKAQETITVYGSSGAENSYVIDGVNTTNVEYGFQGKQLNFEFIESIEVKTGGYEAEYGRATGGIINVITKSGGNEFSGDAFAYYDGDSLQRNSESTVSQQGTDVGFTRKDYGADVGGFIVKDKLWFFAAYDRVDNSRDVQLPDPQAGTVVQSKLKRDLGAAKLTWRLNDKQNIQATFFQDPTDETGALLDASHSLNGVPSSYLGLTKTGGHDYGLRYEGIFGGGWIATAQISRHEDENSTLPGSAAGDAIQYRDVVTDYFQTGGIGLVQEKQFQRDFFGGSLAWYHGNHEIKGGLEYEKQSADVVKRNSGGQQVDVYRDSKAETVYVHRYWTIPTATVDNAPVDQLNASPEHKNTSLYLQDRWQATPKLSLSYGLRYDRQEIVDASGVTQIDLKDIAPRLGVVWDPQGDQKSRLYGSYGRYYEQIPMDLVIRSFSYERQPRIVNFDPVSVEPDQAASVQVEISSAILGGFTEPSDPDLEGQYINEYLLGYEREIAPQWSAGVKGIYRDYGQVIEDFLCADDGTYCIGNPGEGIMKRVFTLDYSRTFAAPKPKRVYKGVQLDVTKRMSSNWQGIASYIWSKLDGNFDGEYAPFTNIGADPNISAAYDYYDFFTDGVNLDKITNDGPLSNDRRHQFKVSGTWITPVKLEVGASAFYRSGTPLTRYGYSDAYGRYEFFLDNRGSEGRNPSNYEVDVHVGYPLQAGRARINFLLDIFSLINSQKAVLLDQRWGFQEADNADSNPANPGYGKAVIRTAPTAVRLGVRVSF